jgi:hypothetical protein
MYLPTLPASLNDTWDHYLLALLLSSSLLLLTAAVLCCAEHQHPHHLRVPCGHQDLLQVVRSNRFPPATTWQLQLS